MQTAKVGGASLSAAHSATLQVIVLYRALLTEHASATPGVASRGVVGHSAWQPSTLRPVQIGRDASLTGLAAMVAGVGLVVGQVTLHHDTLGAKDARNTLHVRAARWVTMGKVGAQVARHRRALGLVVPADDAHVLVRAQRVAGGVNVVVHAARHLATGRLDVIGVLDALF